MNYLRDGNECILPLHDEHLLNELYLESEFYGLDGLSEILRKRSKYSLVKQDFTKFSHIKGSNSMLSSGNSFVESLGVSYVFIDEPIITEKLDSFNSKQMNHVDFVIEKVVHGGYIIGVQKRKFIQSIGFKNCCFPSHFEDIKPGSKIGIWADPLTNGVHFYLNGSEFFRLSCMFDDGDFVFGISFLKPGIQIRISENFKK